jgi:hypothetical protein
MRDRLMMTAADEDDDEDRHARVSKYRSRRMTQMLQSSKN